MAQPLMPKATAVWLVDNTTLTFRQIAEFCGLHELEIKAIADQEVAIGMVGMDPVANGQLTKEEIKQREADRKDKLQNARTKLPPQTAATKGPTQHPAPK